MNDKQGKILDNDVPKIQYPTMLSVQSVTQSKYQDFSVSHHSFVHQLVSLRYMLEQLHRNSTVSEVFVRSNADKAIYCLLIGGG